MWRDRKIELPLISFPTTCKQVVEECIESSGARTSANLYLTKRSGYDILRTVETQTEQVGVINAEGPPVPIPNTEVKLCRADNTWLATAREDKYSPTS